MRTACLLLLSTAAVWADDPPPCPSTDGVARYCAVLTIKDGVTVHGPTRLEPGAAVFQGGAKAELDAFFDSALQKLGPPYRATLNEQQKTNDDAGTLADSSGSLALIRKGTMSIADYIGALQGWCDGDGQCDAANALSVTSDSGIYKVFGKYQDAPLLFDVESDIFDRETGLLIFRVPPPFDSKQVTITLPALSKTAAEHRISGLRNWLGSLDRSLFRRDVIVERVRQYYDPMGLDPETNVDLSARPPALSILEGSMIHGISFPLGLPVRHQEPDWTKVELALYSTLPDRDFRHGYLARRDKIREKLAGQSAPVLEYAADLGVAAGDAPLVDRVRFPIQQLLLQQNGFSLAVTSPLREVVDGHDVSFVDLRLEELEEAPKKDESVAPAPAVPDASGHVEPHAAEAVPRASFAQRVPKRNSTEPAYCRDKGETLSPKKRFAGVGFEYLPGQGVRTFGVGEWSQLRLPFADASISGRAGQGGEGAGIGTGSFFLDNIAFDQLHRRVALQFQGGTDAQANRFLDGQKLNERRNGGMVRAELEWFRDRSGHLLKFFVEGHRDIVHLSRDNLDLPAANLTTIDFGLVHLFQSSSTPYPWMLRLEPVVRVAPAQANAQSYTRGGVRAQFHRALPKGFAVDSNARYEHASDSTPVFELPSLGGAESVRGFRRDDALGQRLWSAQGELWAPIKATNIDFIHNNVKIAGFFDAGNVYRAGAPSDPAFRRGAGLGARVIYGPIVMRADAAYGFGDAATGGARAKFYFSVTTNLPF